ncbi:MAG TPA: hypothetical protein PKC43_01570 [Phycisphaerales bacterium]|nr:hypothetical protein [Phycisphaerales bacterium]HMP36114.1 hypothetical protein [Phycisphaerales bacterium]
MIELAQSYRGWSQKETADALGRNVHAIVPDSGNPKLDMVVSLAEILDWPIEMIVADLRGRMDEGDGPGPREADGPTLTKDEAIALVREAWALCEAERWADVIELTDPERWRGLDGETFGHLMVYRYTAFEHDGRYLESIEACHTGLGRTLDGSVPALRLQVRLAASYYLIGSTFEAAALTFELLSRLPSEPGDPERDALRALASFVRAMALSGRGHVAGGDSDQSRLTEIRQLLETAAALLESSSPEADSRNRALAATSRVAAREVDVELGVLEAEEFVQGVVESLDGTADLGSADSNRAEAVGWQCLFAARAIVRNLDQITNPDRLLAILTNKVDEVAERLGHWAMRERLFLIEHIYRVRTKASRGDAPAWNLDEDELRTLMGTMGRFPNFRPTGWEILRSVRSERRKAK